MKVFLIKGEKNNIWLNFVTFFLFGEVDGKF
jgi:hypothetical protein